MAGFNGKWRLVEAEKMHELQEAARKFNFIRKTANNYIELY